MLDERQRLGRADERRAEIAERIAAVAAPRGEIKRARRLQQTPRRARRESELGRELLDALRPGA